MLQNFHLCWVSREVWVPANGIISLLILYYEHRNGDQCDGDHHHGDDDDDLNDDDDGDHNDDDDGDDDNKPGGDEVWPIGENHLCEIFFGAGVVPLWAPSGENVVKM